MAVEVRIINRPKDDVFQSLKDYFSLKKNKN